MLKAAKKIDIENEMDRIKVNITKEKEEDDLLIDFKKNRIDATVKVFSSCLFSNLIKNKIPKKFVEQFKCFDCNRIAEQRCHGIGEERPVIVKRAFLKLREKAETEGKDEISLKEWKIEFFEQHKGSGFNFKCIECHAVETKRQRMEKKE